MGANTPAMNLVYCLPGVGRRQTETAPPSDAGTVLSQRIAPTDDVGQVFIAPLHGNEQ
jgi:hypothetical protein